MAMIGAPLVIREMYNGVPMGKNRQTFAASDDLRTLLRDAIFDVAHHSQRERSLTSLQRLWNVYLVASWSVRDEAEANELGLSLAQSIAPLKNTADRKSDNLLLFAAREFADDPAGYTGRIVTAAIYSPFHYGKHDNVVAHWHEPKAFESFTGWETCPWFELQLRQY